MGIIWTLRRMKSNSISKSCSIHGSRDNCKVMNTKNYTDLLRKIFEILGIITSHYGHFGRVVGPVKLEFEEVAAELIRILGKSD